MRDTLPPMTTEELAEEHAPRRARPPGARGGHSRREGLPDAGLLRAADHRAVPADRAVVARDGAGGSLQPARDRRRHSPRRRDGVRARPARDGFGADEAQADRGGEPPAPDLRRARALATSRTRLDRARDGV